MKGPHLNTCCFGCDLKSGSLVIAWINMIFSVVIFFSVIQGVHDVENRDVLYETDKNSNVQLVSSILLIWLSLILMIGIYKGIITFLTIWIVSVVLLLIVYSGIFMLLGIMMITMKYTENLNTTGYVLVVFTSFVTLYVVYSIYIIHKYKCQLKNAEKESEKKPITIFANV